MIREAYHGLRVVRAAAAVQIARLAVDLFMLFGAVAQPFFVAVTVMYMLRGRADFVAVFVVVGSALSGLWTVALFEGASGISNERWTGTLELLAAAPVPLFLVVAGKMVGGMLFSLLSLVTSYVIGAWLFGYDVTIREPLPFAVSFLLATVSLWSIGMLFAPIGILSRVAGRFLNVLEYPIYILCGFLFPVLLLPGLLLPLSYALPPYWAAVALHGTSSGSLGGVELAAVWSILLLSSIATVAIAHALFRVVLRRARRDGTLALA